MSEIGAIGAGVDTTRATTQSAPVATKASEAKAAPRETAPRKTPLAPSEIRAALATAYRSIHGEAIPERMLDVLSAQACTETAHGASMYNFNFGGIKGTSPEGFTAKLRTREVFDGEEVTIRDGFRAYSSATEGAKDYLNLLERRFPTALDAARSGDVDGFVTRLKAGRYFTADAGQYAASLRGIVQGGFDDSGPRNPNATTSPLVAINPSDPFGDDPLVSGSLLSSGAGLPTTMAVMRFIDAINASSASIARPSEE